MWYFFRRESATYHSASAKSCRSTVPGRKEGSVVSSGQKAAVSAGLTVSCMYLPARKSLYARLRQVQGKPHWPDSMADQDGREVSFSGKGARVLDHTVSGQGISAGNFLVMTGTVLHLQRKEGPLFLNQDVVLCPVPAEPRRVWTV